MAVCITLETASGKRSMDIQVNEDQRLCDTLTVLVEAGIISGSDVDGITHVYSGRKRTRINLLLSYQEAEILNGDRLYLKREDRKEEKSDEDGDHKKVGDGVSQCI